MNITITERQTVTTMQEKNRNVYGILDTKEAP